MASVVSILSLLATNCLSYEQKLELKDIGRDQPVFRRVRHVATTPLCGYKSIVLT